jgi:hypothetical protein
MEAGGGGTKDGGVNDPERRLEETILKRSRKIQ